MGLLDGKACVVTGGANGIGLAIANAFVTEGASVAIGDIDLHAAEAAAKQITLAGGNAIAVRCNVVDPSQVEELVASCVRDFGTIDVMVNRLSVLL